MIATGDAAVVEGAIDDRKAAAADLAIDPVVEQLIPGRKGLVGDAHEWRWGLASKGLIVLARRMDNLYILDKPAHKVKNSLIFHGLFTSRRRIGKDAR